MRTAAQTFRSRKRWREFLRSQQRVFHFNGAPIFFGPGANPTLGNAHPGKSTDPRQNSHLWLSACIPYLLDLSSTSRRCASWSSAVASEGIRVEPEGVHSLSNLSFSRYPLIRLRRSVALETSCPLPPALPPPGALARARDPAQRYLGRWSRASNRADSEDLT